MFSMTIQNMCYRTYMIELMWYFRKVALYPQRRDGRVAEGARLESVYTARYPGFESLSLRHFPCQYFGTPTRYDS